MNQTGRAQVAPEREGRAGEPLREIPIVVVPGIMGTRLVRRDRGRSTLVWNPAGSGLRAPDPCDAHERTSLPEVLVRVDQPLHADQGHWSFARSDAAAHRRWLRAAGLHPPGFDPETSPLERFDPDTSFGTAYGLISFYLGLCEGLTRLDLSALGYRPRVVCAGYDWRQSNDLSAQTLSQVIERAKEHCGADQVILVAHSMGGIVSRYYCRHLGGRNVKMLFLLASPTHGAPDSYVTLKRGSDEMRVQVMLFGLGGLGWVEQSRTICRVIPSVYQLLPTSQFGAVQPNWLEFDESKTGYRPEGGATSMTARELDQAFSDCRDVRKLYRDIYTGLADGATPRELPDWGQQAASRRNCLRNVDKALWFHDRLVEGNRAWMPPNTHCVHAPSRSTPSGATLASVEPTVNPHGTWLLEDGTDPAHVEERRSNTGDETVPDLSANPSEVTRPFASTFVANDTHATLPSHPSVVQYVTRTIREELAR